MSIYEGGTLGRRSGCVVELGNGLGGDSHQYFLVDAFQERQMTVPYLSVQRVTGIHLTPDSGQLSSCRRSLAMDSEPVGAKQN